MPNVFFNIKVTWPTVTNDIRISIYNPLDLNTPVASQQKNAPHIDQQFSFPGLPRQNFVYKVLETEINGTTVYNQLGQASFVAANDELKYKKPVLIEVGNTIIPGTSGTAIPASTIETNYTGNPTSSSWAFTLKGDVRPGAVVEVDFSWDDGDGTQNETVTSTVLPGWSLSDLVNDLLTKIVAINVNSLAYTDSDNYDGVRVRGLTTASGTVTITNTEAATGGVIWPAGVSVVNIPDWIGWELEASGRVGQYPFKRDEVTEIDISWNAATGDLTLLVDEDVFQEGEYLYFEFQPIISESSGGIPPNAGGGGGPTDILLVTANTTLSPDDIGKKILIDPAGDYLEITLPDITNIQALKMTWFEMQGGAVKCAKIKPGTGQTITWFNNNNLFICPGESFEIYKRAISSSDYEWRLQNLSGNFFCVGEFFYSDNNEGNAVLLNGANLNYQKYARLYDWVTRNPSAIAYATWSSLNLNLRIKFSLKETSGNNFRIPDLNTIPTYLRPKGANNVADYIPAQLLEHQHASSANTSSGRTVTAWGYYHTQVNHIGKYTGEGNYYPDMTSRSFRFSSAVNMWLPVDGNDNNPNTRVSNIYVKF